MDGGDEDEEKEKEDDDYEDDYSGCKQVFCNRRRIRTHTKSQVLVTGLKLFFVGTFGKVVIYDLLG